MRAAQQLCRRARADRWVITDEISRATCSQPRIGWPLRTLALILAADRSHDEDGIAIGIEKVESARAPFLVAGRSKDWDLRAPLAIVGVSVIHFERYAGIPAVSVHRAVESQLNASALDAEQACVAVVGRLEGHLKAEFIDIKALGCGQIVCRENGDCSFHDTPRVPIA